MLIFAESRTPTGIVLNSVLASMRHRFEMPQTYFAESAFGKRRHDRPGIFPITSGGRIYLSEGGAETETMYKHGFEPSHFAISPYCGLASRVGVLHCLASVPRSKSKACREPGVIEAIFAAKVARHGIRIVSPTCLSFYAETLYADNPPRLSGETAALHIILFFNKYLSIR